MRTCFIILALSFVSFYHYGQQVSQWRGPERNGMYQESNLLKEWPAEGPKLLWKFEGLGEGHSSAAISGDVIYTCGTDSENGFLFTFKGNGELLWKKVYGPEWTESYPGTRSTPLVIGDKIYLLSGYGVLYCVNASNGSPLWKVDLFKDYDGVNIKWGITENLAYDGDKLYCTPGGTNANVIALNRNTGELIWKSKGNGEISAYCSPIIINHKGRKIVVTMTANHIIGLDASSGVFLWKFEQPNKYSVHANTPLYFEGSLLCTSGYGKGSVMLKIADDGKSVSQLWFNEELDSKMGGTVLIDGKIYGSGDKNNKWFVVDWQTGKTLFSSEFMKKGNVVTADGMLYAYGENGEVSLLKPVGNSFEVKGKFSVPFGSAQHWAHLVIADKKLYVRHGNAIMVYDIAAK